MSSVDCISPHKPRYTARAAGACHLNTVFMYTSPTMCLYYLSALLPSTASNASAGKDVDITIPEPGVVTANVQARCSFVSRLVRPLSLLPRPPPFFRPDTCTCSTQSPVACISITPCVSARSAIALHVRPFGLCDWRVVFRPMRRPPLPPYPWTRARAWASSALHGEATPAQPQAPARPAPRAATRRRSASGRA